jgi:F-type H+-transporting ATPase subunit delta
VSAVARNYAEALLELATASNAVEQYADLIDAVASAVETTPEVEAALMSPRVPKAKKLAVFGAALQSAPRPFALFIQSVIKRGRQALLRGIATEYLALVDLKLNRVRASVTLARPVDEAFRTQIAQTLAKALGKTVVASFRVDPAILGGTVVRVGDRVLDGSVRRRLARLKRALAR